MLGGKAITGFAAVFWGMVRRARAVPSVGFWFLAPQTSVIRVRRASAVTVPTGGRPSTLHMSAAYADSGQWR